MQDANYGLTLTMIKKIKASIYLSTILSCILLCLFSACGTEANEAKADNALDGGRYFIENYMKGDFSKAKLYLLESPQNKAIFDTLSTHYFLFSFLGIRILYVYFPAFWGRNYHHFLSNFIQ